MEHKKNFHVSCSWVYRIFLISDGFGTIFLILTRQCDFCLFVFSYLIKLARNIVQKRLWDFPWWHAARNIFFYFIRNLKVLMKLLGKIVFSGFFKIKLNLLEELLDVKCELRDISGTKKMHRSRGGTRNVRICMKEGKNVLWSVFLLWNIAATNTDSTITRSRSTVIGCTRNKDGMVRNLKELSFWSTVWFQRIFFINLAKLKKYRVVTIAISYLGSFERSWALRE